VTFDADGVIPDPGDGWDVGGGDTDLRLPLRMDGNPVKFTVEQDARNLTDNWLRLDWAGKALSDGKFLSAPEQVAYLSLAPSIEVVGNAVRASGYAFKADNAFPSLAGRRLFMTPLASLVGKTAVVITVHASDTMPDVANSATWRGGGATQIGFLRTSDITAGEPIAVLIDKDGGGAIWVFVSFAPVAEADADLPSLGFPNSGGIDILDAHVARTARPRAANRKGVLVYGVAPLMREALRTRVSDPFAFPSQNTRTPIIRHDEAFAPNGDIISAPPNSRWHDANGDECAPSGFYGIFPAPSGAMAFTDLGLLRSNPLITIPTGMPQGLSGVIRSGFYSSATHWIVSSWGMSTVYGEGISAAPADRALIDRCAIVAASEYAFLAFDAGSRYFMSAHDGNTSASADSGDVRQIVRNDVRSAAAGLLNCAIVKTDGTVSLPRWFDAGPQYDASALSGVRGFAFAPGQYSGYALLSDGTVAPVGSDLLSVPVPVPPEVASHNITAIYSSPSWYSLDTLLFFYDDTP